MRYIGGKSKLIGEIENFVHNNVRDNSKSFLDLFAGTCSVGNFFKNKYQVYANDKLYFSYAISNAILNNNTPKFIKLKKIGIKDPLDYLNSVKCEPDDTYFIYKNYSPAGIEGRKYLSESNAIKIDSIRQTIEHWFKNELLEEDEYEYLIASLVESVSLVSNTTGTYGAYLKHWDKRAKKDLELKHFILIDNQRKNKAFNYNAEEIVNFISSDICYLDPPYNSRQYSSNYHLLETIARYDYPNIKGVTGIRQSSKNESSLFCKKGTVLQSFDNIIKNIQSRHLIISYSSDGLLSAEDIECILKKYGNSETFSFCNVSYNTYKSKIVNKRNVEEYLFYIRK